MRTVIAWISGVLALGLLVFAIVFPLNEEWLKSLPWEDFGQAGDYIGGMTSGVAVFLFVLSLHLQRLDLQATKDEVKGGTEEQKKHRTEMARSRLTSLLVAAADHHRSFIADFREDYEKVTIHNKPITTVAHAQLIKLDGLLRLAVWSLYDDALDEQDRDAALPALEHMVRNVRSGLDNCDMSSALLRQLREQHGE